MEPIQELEELRNKRNALYEIQKTTPKNTPDWYENNQIEQVFRQRFHELWVLVYPEET